MNWGWRVEGRGIKRKGELYVRAAPCLIDCNCFCQLQLHRRAAFISPPTPLGAENHKLLVTKSARTVSKLSLRREVEVGGS